MTPSSLQVTPAHDPNDFATGKRHDLAFINIFDDNGNINSNETGEFAGMPRFKARVEVVAYLEAKGLLRGTTDNPMRLGLCSRSKDVIEPVLKPQWWVALLRAEGALLRCTAPYARAAPPITS